MFPAVAAQIPGTTLHHNVLEHQAEGRVANDLGVQQKEAQTAGEEATTAHTQQETADLQNPPDKPSKDAFALWAEQNPGHPVADWFKTLNQGKPDKPAATTKVTRIVGGVPHEVLVDSATGEDVKDEGQTRVPGESPDAKRSAAESAQVEREARVNIRKAEGQYRDTQKSVGQLQAAIDASKDGNGLLTSFAPTMEVLGINAANGVHRISPAEAQAAQLPGGWAEQFNQWFDKASTGKMSPELQTEGKQLAGILLKSAHDRYKSTYNDESSIVEGYGGKGFSKRVPMIQDETTPGGGGELKATHIYDPATGTVKPIGQ